MFVDKFNKKKRTIKAFRLIVSAVGILLVELIGMRKDINIKKIENKKRARRLKELGGLNDVSLSARTLKSSEKLKFIINFFKGTPSGPKHDIVNRIRETMKKGTLFT